MLKKIGKASFSIFLLLFSFYYTKVAVDIVKQNNPIMKTIQEEKDKYEVKAVNATIEEDTIIPGISGQKVEVDKSFNTMVRYGEYKDSLYTFEEETPVISLEDNFDKYIIGGRTDSTKVSLVFTVKREEDILDLLTILSENKVQATFFIDGLFIENNTGFIKNMLEEGYEVELLNYNGTYKELHFKSALEILNNLKEEESKFCLSEYKRYKILNICKKLKLHTVIPNVNAKNKPYTNVKNNLGGGSIIRMGNNITELEPTIHYIRQRGYEIVKLEELLSE